MQRSRVNDERWSQALTHVSRGLGEPVDHGGSTPSHTLAALGRLADETVRLRARVDNLPAAVEVCERRTVERDDAISELDRARRDIRLGAAVRGLLEQIERLRDNEEHLPELRFDVVGVADHVKGEVDEVLNELRGSPAAQRECAGVLATALHLSLCQEAPIVRIIEDEVDRLSRRLDRVEARDAGSWDAAKSEYADADHSWLVPGIIVEDCETWRGKVLVVRRGRALVDYNYEDADDVASDGPELDVQWWTATHLRPEGWRDGDLQNDDIEPASDAITVEGAG